MNSMTPSHKLGRHGRWMVAVGSISLPSILVSSTSAIAGGCVIDVDDLLFVISQWG